MSEHGNCPSCGTDLNGGSIWGHFYIEFTEGSGYRKDEEGRYLSNRRLLTHEQALIAADEVSVSYGASRNKGRWGREIGIYDMEKDRTVKWKCPDCDHEWERV